MPREAPHSDCSRVPAHLLNFDSQEWSDDYNTAYSLWRTARDEWVAAGNVWPGGETAKTVGEIAISITLHDEPFDWTLI